MYTVYPSYMHKVIVSLGPPVQIDLLEAVMLSARLAAYLSLEVSCLNH